MRSILAIGVVTLLLVACSPTDACRDHKDEASCVADNACQWKAEKNKCRAVKKEKTSPQSEQTTPAPSEQAAPQAEAPKAEEPSAPGTNYSSPSTETQPQPTYPEGQPQ
jgi:hypothetical protein